MPYSNFPVILILALHFYLSVLTPTTASIHAPITMLGGTTDVAPRLESALTNVLHGAGHIPPAESYYAVTNIDRTDGWHLVSVATFPTPNDDGSWDLDAATWFGLILLLKRPDETFTSAVQGTPEFASLLKTVPDEIIGPHSKHQLAFPASTPAPQNSSLLSSLSIGSNLGIELRSPTAATSPYRFPWSDGTTMKYGPKGVHPADYGSIFGSASWLAVDWLSDGDTGVGHASNQVLAATSGTISAICNDNTSVAVKIDSLIYAHFLDNPNLRVGHFFSQGQAMGQLRSGNFGPNYNPTATCGHADQLPNWFHLHLGFPNTGTFQMDSWSLNLSTSAWTNGSKTQRINAWFMPNNVTTLSADLTRDNIVNTPDWSTMFKYWDTKGGGTFADLNLDGTVNSVDRAILVCKWTTRSLPPCSGLSNTTNTIDLYSKLSPETLHSYVHTQEEYSSDPGKVSLISSASLSLSPSAITLSPNGILTLDISIDTGGVETAGADAVLLYDPTVFQILSIQSGNVYNDYPPPVIDGTGKVQISGVSPVNQTFRGSGLLASANFLVLPRSNSVFSNIRLSFNPNDQTSSNDSNIANVNTTSDSLNSVSDASYTINVGGSEPEAIRVNKIGNGSGTIVSYKGEINCGSLCVINSYAFVSTVLYPVPDAGSIFSGWTNCFIPSNVDSSCLATHSSNQAPRVITATFTSAPTPTLSASPTSVTPGQSVFANWSNFTPSGNDVIREYRVRAADNDDLGERQVTSASGSVAFFTPPDPGSYEFRLFRSGVKAATSNAFVVPTNTLPSDLDAAAQAHFRNDQPCFFSLVLRTT